MQFVQRLLWAHFILFFIPLSLFGQGVTTATIRGRITDQAGHTVPHATVVIAHEPSGTRARTLADSAGQFEFANLRVGGPYTITVVAEGFESQSRSNIELDVDEAAEADFQLASEIVKLAPVKVIAPRGADSTQTGTGSALDEREISETPTVRNDLQDAAVLDPQLNLDENTTSGEFQLSAQGQNYRYNSITVDGVETNDPFGINDNGSNSLRSPVPLDALASLNVALSPYDVRRSGFTGALVNAVTKSGTNHFHGSLSYRYANQDMVGKSPVEDTRKPFQNRTYTATLGGPIVKDRLFFFVVYEYYRRTELPPVSVFTPDATELAAIIAKAKSYGYDPGTATSADNISTQKAYLAKLDWNVSSKHRVSLAYRRTDGSKPQFPDISTSSSHISLSNHWYQQPRKTDSYTLQFFSNWTPSFHTEATLSYSKYEASPVNNGAPFPEVEIGGVDNAAHTAKGQVFLGTEANRQLNQLNTTSELGSLVAGYSGGQHTLTFGANAERINVHDEFVPDYFGSYYFTTPTNWQNGKPISTFDLAVPTTGYTIDDAFANWSLTTFGLFGQDAWRPTPRLTLLSGLRFDYPYVGGKPALNQAFYNSFGLRNDTTGSGNYTVSPRVGFNYKIPGQQKARFRGGLGLFQGRSPRTWISNSFSNTGVIGSVHATSTKLTGVSFNSDPYHQTPPNASLPPPEIDLLDPRFRQPVIWKSNLAIDRELPFWNLVFTAEADFSWVEATPYVTNLNVKPASDGGPATMPDGRIRYAAPITPSTNNTTVYSNSAFSDVMYLTDTRKGAGESYILQLQRRFKDHWSASLAYVHSHATEVSPQTSSRALSNWDNRAAFNPNENVASVSNSNIADKIILRLTREFYFIKHAPTTISVVYRGQTGHPYSWVFFGDANGDGATFNDLFYMPSGPNDPKVRWNKTSERDAFFAAIQTNGLAAYSGRVAPRNGETNPWINTIDLHITQAIHLYHKAELEFYFDLLNFANLLNKHWGIVDGIDFPYTRAVVSTTYDKTANGGQGQYVYNYNNNTQDSIGTFSDASRWQAQAGLRLKF